MPSFALRLANLGPYLEAKEGPPGFGECRPIASFWDHVSFGWAITCLRTGVLAGRIREHRMTLDDLHGAHSGSIPSFRSFVAPVGRFGRPAGPNTHWDPLGLGGRAVPDPVEPSMASETNGSLFSQIVST